MENEEEENSKLPLQLENDSTMTAVTATTNAQSPNGLPYTEPQCGPHPEAEECQPQLGAGDGESQFLSTETETKLPDTREYRDAVAGENTSAVDVGDMEVGGVRVQSQSPPSLTPQLPLAEGGRDESAKVEQQSVQVEEEDRFIKTSEIMQEVLRKDEKDRDLIPSEGGHEAKNNNYSPNNNDDDGDAYKGVEDNDGDVNAGLGVPGVNNGTEIKTEVIADVVDNSEMAAEQKVTCRTEEPALADEVEKNIGKTDVKEQSNEEATDVAEGAKIADMGEDSVEVKEENEVETDVEEEKEETREEHVLAEEMEVAEQTEMGDIAEETKAAEEVPNGTGEMNEMELADRMEVQDKEEMYVANAGEEMEETEETEETKAVEEVPNETGEMDEMELADSMEEQDKEEMHVVNVGEETEEMEETEETEEADNAAEMELADGTDEAEEEVEEVSKSAGGKRKRGKNVKASARTLSRKKIEEDVCFICFDGGDLVLCDRRGCPKAYHPTCVNRDEAFFRAKGRWNCGWHLCSICEKNAYYMCYTCTFSLCKGCIKDAVILCVRGNKGFCESCLKTVMLIERNEQENKETAQVDFDDKSSWEYLFKDYWLELKGRLSLTSDELSQAKNPWKGSELSVGKRESRDELYDAHNRGGSGSGNSSGSSEVNPSKKGKAKKRLKYHSKERDSTITKNLNDVEEALKDESTEWASKELLEFIMHMKNGDKSGCSQFDVQALLLEYIKINKLRDPRRKSQIICDSRLEKLFRKPRVGHFEMLKLLESHFLLKEDSQADDLQGSVVDTEANSEADGNSDGLVKGSKDRRRRSRKKSDGRGLQSNFDDYAAIDTNNINLIYLRRSLVENLIDDTETFHDKVVGSFVRIRISGSAQKQDLYRLVQVVGTNKAAEPYKVGKRTTDFLLDILNLNKTEIVSIDIISNQDFTEDECKRLRQSIKCGLINRLTVGDIQEKAMALQAVRVEDSLEAEITRLSHLRDRASDLGRRKELRECVEKLQLLKSPKERQRRLEEIPEVHADPNMDPSYESEEDGEMDDKRQENYLRPGGSSFNRRGREPISPGRGREPISPGRGSLSSNDSWSGSRSYSSTKRELSRSSSNKGFSIKRDDVPGAGEILSENLWSQGRDKETQPSQSWEKPKSAPTLDARTVHSSLSSESIPIVKQEIAMGPPATAVAQSATKINETEKIWHYKDPSGKIQGPFSMVQLRKWSNTGYFPAELGIWRTTEKQDDSILLTDALTGNFQRDPELVQSQHLSSSYSINAEEGWKSQREISNSTGRAAPTPLEVSKYSTDKWDSETNLPSPTPAQAARSATKGQPYESKWSPTQAQSAGSRLGTNSLAGGNREVQHPAVIVPESGQLSHSSTPSSSLIKLPGSANSPRMHSQSTLPGESPRVQVTSHLLPAPDSSAASVNVAVDMKSLQNLVNPVAGNNPLVVTQGWGTVSVSKAEMGASHAIPASGSQVWGSVPSQKIEQNNSVPTSAHPGAYGNWGDTQPSVHNSASSFTAGNPSGFSSAPATSGLVPSDIWRGAIQSNIQPSAPSNAPWGMSIADNQAATPRQGPENQNSAWGPIPGNPNLGWGGSVPTNSNQGWVVSGQGPAPGNANPGWIQHGQGQAPGNGNPGWAAPVQGQALGNAFPGWVPSGQGPAPVNANQAWVAPGQGPSHGNGHSGWTAPPGNVGSRGSEKSQSGGRFSSQRESGSQGGDSDYGGTKPWNRQSSFSRGGDSSRPAFKGQRVCKYHENGHCKKGAACDYLHT